MAERYRTRAGGTGALVREGAPARVKRRTKVSPLTGERSLSVAELKGIKEENLRRAFAERRRILDDTLSVKQVAELFAKGRQYPHDRRKAGTLLAIRDEGKWAFPTWQFDAAGPDGVVAGLPKVLKSMKGPVSELGRVTWFTTPKPLLSGRTPLQALADGDVEEVATEAESIGAS